MTTTTTASATRSQATRTVPHKRPASRGLTQDQDPIAAALSEAEQYSAERAALAGQRDAVERAQHAARARHASAVADRDAARVALADTQTLAALGVAQATRDNAQGRLVAAQAAVDAAESELARLDAVNAELTARMAAAEEAEAQARERPRVLRQQTLEAERAALVQRCRAAAAAYVRALGDVGAWNWQHHLLEPIDPKPSDPWFPTRTPQVGGYGPQARPAPKAPIAPITFEGDSLGIGTSYFKDLPMLQTLPDFLAAEVEAVE